MAERQVRTARFLYSILLIESAELANSNDSSVRNPRSYGIRGLNVV